MILSIYNPYDWYWLADDGRLYASARGGLADASDPAYLSWGVLCGVATPWPRDDDGVQTDAALQQVLTPYGLDLWPQTLTVAEAIGALTDACAECIVGGFRSAALGAEHIYPSRQTDQINLMGSVTGSLLPDLPSDWTTPFWCADEAGVWAFRAHTAAQIQQAGAAGKAHVVACQAALAELSAAVLAAPSEEALRQILWVDPPSAAAL